MTDIKKAEKKKNILNTAIALFQKNTVAATAVDDIVKAAGIARGTFYLYFKDKSDLLEQVIMMKSRETLLGALRDYYFEVKSRGGDFRDLAEKLLVRYIEFLCGQKDTLCILKKNISSVMRNAPDLGDEEANVFFEEVLGHMVSVGYTRENAIKTLYMTVDMIGSVCSDSILTGKPYPIDEMKQNVVAGALAIMEAGLALSQTNGEKGDEIP